MIHVLYPVLLTVTIEDGSVHYIAAKSQVAGLKLAIEAWPGLICKIRVSIVI